MMAQKRGTQLESPAAPKATPIMTELQYARSANELGGRRKHDSLEDDARLEQVHIERRDLVNLFHRRSVDLVLGLRRDALLTCADLHMLVLMFTTVAMPKDVHHLPGSAVSPRRGSDATLARTHKNNEQRRERDGGGCWRKGELAQARIVEHDKAVVQQMDEGKRDCSARSALVAQARRRRGERTDDARADLTQAKEDIRHRLLVQERAKEHGSQDAHGGADKQDEDGRDAQVEIVTTRVDACARV